MEIVLYHMPGACSRVTLNALEEAELAYTDHAVDLFKGQQKSSDYLAINPKGKVPALVVNGQLLTENAAILPYIDALNPSAGLLPHTVDPFARAKTASDLAWCSGTLQPIVRSILSPARLTAGDTTPVVERGMQDFKLIAESLERRLALPPWWYGEIWSILDVYIYWNYSIAQTGGFDMAPYPAVIAHSEGVRARPSFHKALAREQAALKQAGIVLPHGLTL